MRSRALLTALLLTLATILQATAPTVAEPACPETYFSGPTSESNLACIGAIIDEGLLGPALGLALRIDAPDEVFAGQPFSVTGEVELNGLGASIVQVLPIVVAGVCTVVEMDITGGIPLGGGYYLMTSDLALVPFLDRTGDPTEQFNELDVHMTLDTVEDLTGSCEPGFTAIELPNQLIGLRPYAISDIVRVVEVPATPIEVGIITTTGGNDVPDGATVTIPAVPPPPASLPIVVLTSDPKVALRGGIIHKEIGPTVADEGYFEIQENGVKVNHATLTKKSDSKFLDVERSLPYEEGKTIRTTYCLFGVYIDDGIWEAWEGPAKTCMVVAATTPKEPDVAALLAKACAAFLLPTTQADLLQYGTALAADPSSVSGLALGAPTENAMTHFLFDHSFGDRCL